MPLFDAWSGVVKAQEPLAPHTYLRLGGPAQWFAVPRSEAELVGILKEARQEKLPVRILAGGCNVLVKDDGVPGLVIRLSEPSFAEISISGATLRAGAGCPLTAAISEAARASLSGLEGLIGIPGAVGGALRSNAGSRAGNLMQPLSALEWLTPDGRKERLEKEELPLDQLASGVGGHVILAAEFTLEKDNPDDILKRMRRLWIQKKSRQPLSFQAVGRLFKAPGGLPIEQYLEEAGVSDLAVGGASLSERNPNYVVVREGATARDVLRLIDMVRTAVHEKLGQTLQLALDIW